MLSYAVSTESCFLSSLSGQLLQHPLVFSMRVLSHCTLRPSRCSLAGVTVVRLACWNGGEKFWKYFKQNWFRKGSENFTGLPWTYTAECNAFLPPTSPELRSHIVQSSAWSLQLPYGLRWVTAPLRERRVKAGLSGALSAPWVPAGQWPRDCCTPGGCGPLWKRTARA